MQTEEKFSYSTQPHAAPVKRKTKYRGDSGDLADSGDASNIMYDPRVIRGNTYSAKIMSSSLRGDLDKSSKKVPPRMRKTIAAPRRSSTPPPIDGRSHADMQTDDFLEEITDRPIEQEAETQTLPFMDRPASPLFVRAKIGFDVETQIESGDLFDFDLEVEPILEVLVGKTIHVSMLELMQEEELEAIRLQQEEFETIRNIEMAEVQRLEAQLKRNAEERERRIAQEKKRVEDQRNLEETIAARAFSNQFLGELHIDVFNMLEEKGEFYDPVEREVEELFMPDLIQDLIKGADSYEAASQIAFELIEAARRKAKEFEAIAIKQRNEWLAKIAEEEAERKRKEEEERLAAEAAKKAAEEAEEGGEGEA